MILGVDVQEVVDVFQGVAVGLAALAAIWGIDAWRREFVGKKRIELAEEVLARFYEAQDAIRSIRNPFSLAGEGSSRERAPGESDEEAQILNNAYVVFERYQANREVFNSLRALRYRFMAYHGRGASKPFDDLYNALNRVFFAARSLPRYWQRQGRNFRDDAAFQRHLEQMEKEEAIFWEEGPNDEINAAVDQALQRIEEICRAQIELQVFSSRPFAWTRGLFRALGRLWPFRKAAKPTSSD